MLPVLALVLGLALLVWSADRFVAGSAAMAHHLGMPPLLIGMGVMGFGTSAPEMVVSAISAWQGNPGIALGNAYGSNIVNIALILGCSALISPITVHSQVLRKELPILTAATALAVGQIWDGEISRMDAALLLAVFAGHVAWSIRQARRHAKDALENEIQQELHPMPLPRALFWLLAGLLLLVASSRILVWAAVIIAQNLGVPDLVIGLTIVALGTSLPELAASIAATRKHEHDLALGNVIGSNMFNTLAVVGIAGAIHPITPDPQVLRRDMLVMSALTLCLFAIGYGFRGPGRINRIEATGLLATYIGYISFLVRPLLHL